MSNLSELAASITGRVITPDDADYDEARAVFYGGFDRRPAAIVRPASAAADVVTAVDHARSNGMELAVRGGGHSAAGYSTTEGGLLLDLRDLNEIEIDAGGRTAWVGAGLTAGEVVAELQKQGFVVGFGDTGSVGIGGLTLGGGIGYLVRKHGLTIDSVLAADVVTANGDVVRTDADTHPDLFWAIRGGGGNFGVVTRFKYRLHELGQVLGGLLILPATADVIAGFIAAAEAAPDELSTIANIMPAPPMPMLAEDQYGQLILMAGMVWSGEMADAERVLAPFRELATPLADLLNPMAYPEMFPAEDEPSHPTAVSETMFTDRIDTETAATILRHLEDSDAPLRVAQLRVLGGAMARVPQDATAFAHRSSRIMVNLAALYEAPDERSVHAAWVSAFADALRGADSGAYVNFLEDVGESGVERAYPEATRARLADIKHTYDPENLFHRNLNIAP